MLKYIILLLRKYMIELS